MKVFLIALFVCVATITNAQTKKFDYYSTESLNALDATPEQHTKVRTLYDAMSKKFADVRNDATLSTDEKKAKNKELYAERAAEYYKILTPEQKAKASALRKANDK